MSDIVEANRAREEAKQAKAGKRMRRCRDIVGVIASSHPDQFDVVSGWPSGIVRADKAVATAKKMQASWADGMAKIDVETEGVLHDIVLMRRLATVRASSQRVMSFKVE